MRSSIRDQAKAALFAALCFFWLCTPMVAATGCSAPPEQHYWTVDLNEQGVPSSRPEAEPTDSTDGDGIDVGGAGATSTQPDSEPTDTTDDDEDDVGGAGAPSSQPESEPTTDTTDDDDNDVGGAGGGPARTLVDASAGSHGLDPDGTAAADDVVPASAPDVSTTDTTDGTPTEPSPLAQRCTELGGVTACVQPTPPALGELATVVGAVPAPAGGMPAASALPTDGLRITAQGECASCLPIALGMALDIRHFLSTGFWQTVSPSDIWHAAGYGGWACPYGSEVEPVLSSSQTLSRYHVSIDDWAYLSSDPVSSLDRVPSQTVLEDSGIVRTGEVVEFRVGSSDDVRRALAQGWPAVLVVPVHVNHGWETGRIDVHAPGDLLLGYHAVTPVEDDGSQVTFANPWGPDWADAGYGTMTLDFIEEESLGGVAVMTVEVPEEPGPAAGCGDGACSDWEDEVSCPADCAYSQGVEFVIEQTYPDWGPLGCSGDGTAPLRASAEQIDGRTIRFYGVKDNL